MPPTVLTQAFFKLFLCVQLCLSLPLLLGGPLSFPGGLVGLSLLTYENGLLLSEAFFKTHFGGGTVCVCYLAL